MPHECVQQDTIKELTEFKGATEVGIKALEKEIYAIRNNDLKHIIDKIDKLKSNLSNRPSWAIFWVITTLTTILIGIIGYEIGKLIK